MNPKEARTGNASYMIGFLLFDLKIQELKLHGLFVFYVAKQLKGLVYKNSDFTVLSRILKNSCAENGINVCKAFAIYGSFVKNVADWN